MDRSADITDLVEGLGKTADLLLERLEQIDFRKSKRDAAGVEKSLRAIYEALQKPFPGFQWVPDVETAVLKPLEAGVERFRAAGAPRTAGFHFQALAEAVSAAAGTGPMHSAWRNAARPFGMRCGSEPREFQNQLSRLENEARTKASKLLKPEKLDRQLEADCDAAAKTVVKKAGTLFLPEERKMAAKDLANAARCSTVNTTRELLEAVKEMPEWEFRGHDLSRHQSLVLLLMDAVDAGLWCFWPAPDS